MTTSTGYDGLGRAVTRQVDREQLSKLIDEVARAGEVRNLERRKTAYWKAGNLVIRDPSRAGGGTPFGPGEGYLTFLRLK